MKTGPFKLIYWYLGSIWFAVPLFVVALILVMAGTFIESAKGSHEAAASRIYGTTYFNALLSLFFVNILVSALHRIPWKKRHAPFLLTHLGLLMVIGGTMAKNIYGLQGHMVIKEGSSSNTLFLTGTEALVLKELNPGDPLHMISTSYPIDRLCPSGFERGPYQLLSYAKNCDTSLEGFVKKEGVKLLGYPFLPKQGKEFSTTAIKLGDDVWNVACVETDDIESALTDKTDTILFVESYDQTALVATGSHGERFIKTLSPIESYNAYGRGFGGYTVELNLGPFTIESPLTERIRLVDEGRPAMIVELEDKERVALAYDPTGEGIQWPVANGTKLASFTPKTLQLPRPIRLLRAHKTYYPGTDNVESYTAHIFTEDNFYTLEMNQVYESKEGYRFYLSNLLGEEGVRKSVQITVNYDPFRYKVTYPGALLLSMGMILLFLPKKKKR